MAKTATPKDCDCIKQVNAKLSDSNAEVETRILLDFKTNKVATSGAMVLLSKIDPKKRKSLPAVMCAFCQFCGKKYK
jgi:hypothetical protein